MSTETTRRALIGGAGLAVIATGLITNSTPAPASETDFDPMEGFAVCWLERWTDNGGSVTRQPDGTFIVGQFEYSFGPCREDDVAKMADSDWYQALPADKQEMHMERHLSWYGAFHVGKMRELQDMLYAVPGAVEAVKRVVALQPHHGAPRFAREAV